MTSYQEEVVGILLVHIPEAGRIRHKLCRIDNFTTAIDSTIAIFIGTAREKSFTLMGLARIVRLVS